MQLLIAIGGLALVFLTEYDTFGWVLVGIAAVLTLIQLLFFGLVFGKANKQINKSFNSWDKL